MQDANSSPSILGWLHSLKGKSMGVFDSETIEIPCEGCGKEHSKTIGWIKTHSEISCTCGATIKLDKGEFVRGLAGVDKALDNLMKPRNTNIKIKM